MLKSLNKEALGPKQMVQVLLGGAGLILVVGGAAMFLMNSQIHDLQGTVNSKESQVGTNEQVAKRFQQTQGDYDAILARTQYLEASVSATAYVPTLLKQLQGLAQTTHLTVVAVRPGQITAPAPPPSSTPSGGSSDSAAPSSPAKKAPPPPPYDTLDIGVDVSGTYADTAAFLYGLTRFPKIVSVANVQMHPGAPDPKNPTASPVLTTNLHLTAFVFHDSPAIPALAGTPAPAVATLGGANPAAALRALPMPGAVSDAAAHAAGRAIGATRAIQARNEVGVQTL